jgi:hypothetical protein
MATIFETGPYLKMAIFCEKILRETDGVVTLVRVIDRITQTAAGPGAPEEMPPLTPELMAVLMLVPGQARGSFPVRIELELPSGERRELFTTTVHMESEDRGVNLVVNIRYSFETPGLYWFNVYLDKNLMTRMPLRIIYVRTSVAPPLSP